jgi:hypothetical protein
MCRRGVKARTKNPMWFELDAALHGLAKLPTFLALGESGGVPNNVGIVGSGKETNGGANFLSILSRAGDDN